LGQFRVNSFSVSADGYGAGPGQDIDTPMGRGGMRLHDWAFRTRTFQHHVFGRDGGETGPEDDLAAEGFENIGAWIMGRNMFGPRRGPWARDDDWRGWWGDEPPYHVPVFVLTNHPRAPIEMQGGTVFYFVTDGIAEALDQARAAAGARDIRLGGGVATIREYLRAGLLDRLHIAVAPVLLGGGEALFAGLDLPALGYRVARHQAAEVALHLILERDGGA